MKVGALHCNDYVQVELQHMRYSLLDTEMMRLIATEPRKKLGECEKGTCDNQDDCPLTSASSCGSISGFCFSCRT